MKLGKGLIEMPEDAGIGSYLLAVEEELIKCREKHVLVQDAIAEALQSDLEHGVKWLNEAAVFAFTTKYPELNVVLEKILGEVHE